ncbi:hypothetical protein B0F90DRAFT_1629620 [Multifurca ochricompacta]|uniref:Kinetochore protein Sos7 coiled-coil domain-containing protein n=1 Tax=Multifurca ochricompacta TaxID=376703 RepID=A0AAD4M3I9_9AGAM|nr:hypothetical protein B0F90DRAFT_1629620 [Multifurca ochricompacta]
MSVPTKTGPIFSGIDSAKQLQVVFDTAHLRIRDIQVRFNSRTPETSEIAEDALGRRGSSSTSQTPDALAAEVSDYMSFMRKLKFQYLENNAKDKYVKTIVNDEAPMITADTNADMQAANLVKKDKLKAAKSRLITRHSDIRNLAPLVEQDYLKAKGLAAEATALTQSILDARLAITRLRQAHPSPRLTIPVAEGQLSSQIADMQLLEDELQAVNERISRVKDAAREGTVDIDRLRSEKAELEKKVAAHRVDADDGRAVDLCNWFDPHRYTSSLALHRLLFNMQSSRSISENELILTYTVDHPSDLTTAQNPRVIMIALLFLPNTRQLADVRVEGLEGVDITNTVDSFVQANDAPGLIWHILSRARQTFSSSVY